ncbi:A24 family peptidase [Phenylobacterium conjunctum]|jgi:prepilin peptidase CpaA|uniref:Prepilin peptidase n=1 Tax=Phenylobacterium conjunctum TaxID=1298959 RepID=A0ABW3T7X9_9CAUL|nr:prepilin peptidase [Deltaproteobacteria bacterium]
METTIHGALLAMLAGCIFSDVKWRRIPNFLCLGIALLGLAETALDTPGATFGRLLISGALFVGGLALHQKKILGGGDIKLLAALSIFLAPIELRLFILLTLIAGGFVGLFYMGLGWLRRLRDKDAPLVSNVPYALAIVVGFIFIRPMFLGEFIPRIGH